MSGLEIISPFELRNKLNHSELRIFDVSTALVPSMSGVGYDAFPLEENWIACRIPNSMYIDVPRYLSEQTKVIRVGVPSKKKVTRFMLTFNLGIDDPIVLYEQSPSIWATRVWWMLFILGFKRVSILDGGIKEWEALGYEIETSVTSYSHAKFEENIDKSVFVDKDVTLGSMNKSDCTLLNALTSDIHKGENPRYGRPGRIPGSLNIPFHELVDSETGKLVSPEKAMKVFSQENISSDDNILNYCGGGIAATLNAFIQRQLGFKNMQIYDNSMSEWAMDSTLPIETD